MAWSSVGVTSGPVSITLVDAVVVALFGMCEAITASICSWHSRRQSYEIKIKNKKRGKLVLLNSHTKDASRQSFSSQ